MSFEMARAKKKDFANLFFFILPLHYREYRRYKLAYIQILLCTAAYPLQHFIYCYYFQFKIFNDMPFFQCNLDAD